MRGYWEEPDRTAEAIDSARWMRTGDLAQMDADGYVRIVGRIKDTVIRGGENIAPREVEEFPLHNTTPMCSTCRSSGARRQVRPRNSAPCVRVADGASLDAAAIREFCAGRISHHKIPRYVEVVESFPDDRHGEDPEVFAA